MLLIMKLFLIKLLRFFLPVFILFVSSYARGQTYSTEEIVISGLGFARFSVSLIAEDRREKYAAKKFEQTRIFQAQRS